MLSGTRTTLHLPGLKTLPVKSLSWGYCLAKRPTTGRPPRLPCATAARAAPHNSPDSFSLKAPGNCENRDKSFSHLQRIKKQVADPSCSGNQCSARDSHYSYGQLFCNTFFRRVSSEGQSCIFTARRRVVRSSILLRKSCLRFRNVKTWLVQVVFLLWRSSDWACDFLRKCALEYRLKKRSPNVWRYYCVCAFSGPTKCRCRANHRIDASCFFTRCWTIASCAHAIARERTKRFTRKEFLSRRWCVQSVVSARL